MNNNHENGTDRKPLAAEILARIRTEDIRPLPRWRFILPRIAFWGITALSVVLGSHVVVGVLSVLLDLNGDLPAKLPIWVFVRAGAATLPLLWLVLILALVIIATLVIRTTGRGYRFPIGRILCGTVLATLALGGALYAAGDRPPLERYLDPAGFGPSVRERHVKFWAAPEDGRIIGRVVSLSGGTMEIETLAGDTRALVFPSERPLPEFVATGTVVRAVGEWDGAVFRVESFLPDRPLPRGFEEGRDFFGHGRNLNPEARRTRENAAPMAPGSRDEFPERKTEDGTYEYAGRPILE